MKRNIFFIGILLVIISTKKIFRFMNYYFNNFIINILQ